MAKRLPTILCSLGLAGCGYGLWSLSQAAAFIAAGALCIAIGVDQHRRNAKEAKK